MTTNLENLNRLIAELERMKREDPDQFDYGQGYALEDPHCVDCVCRRLNGSSEYLENGKSIALFLNISDDTAKALWSPYLSNHSLFGRSNGFGEDEHTKGELGITEALRRLYLLRDMSTEGREAAFLAELIASLADCRENEAAR